MPFLPTKSPIVESNGYVTPVWLGFFQQLLTLAAGGIYTVTTAPTLKPEDAGRVIYLSDFRHAVRWTGTVWEFAPGDCGNGFLALYGIVPQETGWGYCDGSTYSYLVVGGATLTTADYTTGVFAGYWFRQ